MRFSRGNRVRLGIFLCCLQAACISFGQAPANDNFTNAIALHGSYVLFTSTTANTTFEPGESTNTCGHPYASLWKGSVWWSWTATNSSVVVIDLAGFTGQGVPGAVAVETGTNVASLTEIACFVLDLFPNRYLTFSATAGTTYLIRVFGESISFTLRLIATNSPVILSPPKSQTLSGESSVLFTVLAAGVHPLKYQWRFEGQDLPGETVPTMIFHNLATNQAGAYSVVVSNATGVTTSSVANLTVSTVDPRPQLAALRPTSATNFDFALTGQLGRRYLIVSTTNFADWAWENLAILNTNSTSILSVPRSSNAKFLRASFSLQTEKCLAQLQQINFAGKLWAIENQIPNLGVGVTEQDITPYMKTLPICPSGGSTFSNSYVLVNDLRDDVPLCKWVPWIHYLDCPCD